MLKLLEQRRGENLLDLWDRERVLKQDTEKSTNHKKIINKLGYMKRKHFYSAKDPNKSPKMSHRVEDNFNTYNHQWSYIQIIQRTLNKITR